MTALTVWKFPTADAADKALVKVQSLQKAQLLTLVDAATVSWPQGKKKPKTKQMVSMGGVGALGGAFWGMLFGLIFFIPFFGLVVGAAMGALMGHFRDYGIDDDFIKQVREKVTEGTSALFLYTADVTLDKVSAELKGMNFELMQSNLTAEQEAKLREALAEEE